VRLAALAGAMVMLAACAAPSQRASREAVPVRSAQMSTLGGKVAWRSEHGGYLLFTAADGAVYVLHGAAERRLKSFVSGERDGLPIMVTGFPLQKRHPAGPLFELLDYRW
jgi:hypothetical protein